jgi:adenine-specific DNA-methyltransferase
MLYPKGPLRDALNERPELEAEIFDKLRNISPEKFVSEGRVYGGGLHKVEPKELARIPVETIFGGLESVLRRGQQLTMSMT